MNVPWPILLVLQLGRELFCRFACLRKVRNDFAMVDLFGASVLENSFTGLVNPMPNGFAMADFDGATEHTHGAKDGVHDTHY